MPPVLAVRCAHEGADREGTFHIGGKSADIVGGGGEALAVKGVCLVGGKPAGTGAVEHEDAAAQDCAALAAAGAVAGAYANGADNAGGEVLIDQTEGGSES